LHVAEISVSYGGLVALDSVSVAVPRSTVVGLIGPNGAGKTTCIDAISGFTPIGHGRIDLAGRDLGALGPHRRARAGIARTFQSIELFDDLTVAENLAVASTPYRWYSPLVDMVRPRRTAVDVEWALEFVGLEASAGARPTALSHGERRLVGVARALSARPAIVLLDEPAAGLDGHETEALADVIRRLPSLGCGVLLVDHDMRLVLDVCASVTVLDFGRVIASGPPDAVRRDRAVVDAYLGSHEIGGPG
jgi:branched-chain amino acid transport system ATP-binding protein